jgi:predicted heme/steroid binding protein
VTTKSANQPFLQSIKLREKETTAKKAREERRKAKLAKGEPLSDDEDEQDSREVGILDIAKVFLFVFGIFSLSSLFITGTWFWGFNLHEEFNVQLRRILPSQDTLFTDTHLAEFDGTRQNKPVYIGIDGIVYDVSTNRATYGPGGSYHMMAGRDAARAYVTGCFKDHLTHDLRGLTDKQLASLEGWKKFYVDHKHYRRVGRVIHRPIDPSSPIPPPCDDQKNLKSKEQVMGPEMAPGPVKTHKDDKAKQASKPNADAKKDEL